jgi:hypothetical protein
MHLTSASNRSTSLATKIFDGNTNSSFLCNGCSWVADICATREQNYRVWCQQWAVLCRMFITTCFETSFRNASCFVVQMRGKSCSPRQPKTPLSQTVQMFCHEDTQIFQISGIYLIILRHQKGDIKQTEHGGP